MTLYDELQGVAGEILADPDFKQGVISLIRSTPGTGPVDDPGPSTLVTVPLNAVAAGVPFKFIQGNLAIAGDLMVTASIVEGVDPTLADFIDIDGKRYKVIQYVPTPPAGVAVVWKWIVRYGE